MLTFNELYDRYTDFTKDASATNVTRGKALINAIDEEVLTDRDWSFLEKERTAVTVASQKSYRLPPDYDRFKNLKVTVSSIDYTPTEVLTFEEWNALNQTTSTSDIPTRFFIFEDYFRLFPAPSSAGNTITLTYTITHKEMTVADYVTGTITATSGSTAVVGSGTAFTSAMVGRWIKIAGRWYQISAVADTTHLTLYKAAVGDASGTATHIGEMSPIPGAFHDLLWKGPLFSYFNFKGDTTEGSVWEKQFRSRLFKLHDRYGEKTDSAVLPPRVKMRGRFHSLLRTPDAGSMS